MFASSHGPRSAARRRGIVLVLVLGMLGLMALIGVTFATFAGQTLKNSRNNAQGAARPQPEALMDYALAQLINDSNNPLSAIRGHSLLRDMYGNDSVFRGSNPPGNAAVETGGLLTSVYTGGSYAPLVMSLVGLHSTSTTTPFYNQLQYSTNIPTTGQYAGLDFTRWIVRFAPNNPSVIPSVPQSFEVLEDVADSSGYHYFTLSANLGNPRNDPAYANNPLASGDTATFAYSNPNLGATEDTSTSPAAITKGFSALAREYSLDTTTYKAISPSTAFVLDGRYMRAFNGPGLTRPSLPDVNSMGTQVFAPAYPYNAAAYANMRVIGSDPGLRTAISPGTYSLGNPDVLGMDEDYDACDLENWFLAIQSADGQVMIPSFHRPGILTAADWILPADDGSGNVINAPSRSKILRPRQIDNSPLFPTDPSILDASGKLTYDIDNDGDGVTDSVWLDLGYPVQRDTNGRLSKPLFAFMVLGLNGRLPLNTVGNLQARAIGDPTHNTDAAEMVPYPTSSGQIPYPGLNTGGNYHNQYYSSQAFYDAPLFDHTSHLGYSVNEINPKFALQNAPSNLYSGGLDAGNTTWSQQDNVYVDISLTQLRNLLAGTRPTSATNPFSGTYPAENGDHNFVAVNSLPWLLPNNMYDATDFQGTNSATMNPATSNSGIAVAGRWGEPEGIPSFFPSPVDSLAYDTVYPTYLYNNFVRAGRSIYGASATNDVMDDDFDDFDPYLATPFDNVSQTFTLTADNTTPTSSISIPLNIPGYTSYDFRRNWPEDHDRFDTAGQMAIATERARRFVTPQDTAGVGRLMGYMKRPASDNDYGMGADKLGRSGYFRYFRPAGMPQEVRYPYDLAATDTYAFPSAYPYATGSGNSQRFLMPVLIPPGQSVATGTAPGTKPDVSNNLLHGWQAAATPATSGYTTFNVAVMGAMPFDYDPSLTSTPAGYAANLALFTPTIAPLNLLNPGAFVNSAVNSSNGPNLGTDVSLYPIPYSATVVNGYLGGSLNKDEADEMNLYTANRFDMPFGPTDLEWLYRKHDVDGATLNSRLSGLAPISFTNPTDGLTRRRMFSTDAWDITSFAYANDNPIPYAGVLGGYRTNSPDHDFTYNSRFMPYASPSLELTNQVVSTSPGTIQFLQFANPITTEFLPNPTLPVNTPAGGTINTYIQNSNTTLTMPMAIDPSKPNSAGVPYNLFSTNAFYNATINPYTNVIIPAGNNSAAQLQTPSLAHRDRKINLNIPLPISNDPAEPVRQKWCREAYQMLKAILPPAAIDTPEELAALSQFVVNVIDFRDPDCTMTRFVNTDLEVVDALTRLQSIVPDSTTLDTTWNVTPPGVRFATGTHSLGTNFPFDPSLYSPDTVSPFLVQHGMEYNPIAINEAFALQSRYGKATDTTLLSYQALFVELVNTLTESQNSSGTGNSSAIKMAGWDMIFTPDNYGWGRPDPISGEVNPIAYPPNLPDTAGALTATDPPAQSQRPTVTTSGPLNAVQRVEFNSTVKAITAIKTSNPPNPGNDVDYFVVGDYEGDVANTVEVNPVVTGTIDASIDAMSTILAKGNPSDGTPTSILTRLPKPATGTGLYYWVYSDDRPTHSTPRR